MKNQKKKTFFLAWILALLQIFTPSISMADGLDLFPKKPVFQLNKTFVHHDRSKVIEIRASYDLLEKEMKNSPMPHLEYWTLDDLSFSGTVKGSQKIDISEEEGFVLENKEEILQHINSPDGQKGDLFLRLLVPKEKEIDWGSVKTLTIEAHPHFLKREYYKQSDFFKEEKEDLQEIMDIFTPKEGEDLPFIYLKDRSEEMQDLIPEFNGPGLYFYKVPSDLQGKLSDYSYEKEEEVYGKEEANFLRRQNRLTPYMAQHLGYLNNQTFMSQTLPKEILSIEQDFAKISGVSTKEELFDLKKSTKEKIDALKVGILKNLKKESFTKEDLQTLTKLSIQKEEKKEREVSFFGVQKMSVRRVDYLGENEYSSKTERLNTANPPEESLKGGGSSIRRVRGRIRNSKNPNSSERSFVCHSGF